ncbi:hypothetical protein [Chondromyces apiculatus]|uniref:Translation initiation factor 2 n=1 Tax=Chondromyces apiculatus DSM 436 TaxID=1192034 RepID=A0A017TIE2_9BACT|nr:hypothetical protein [Chondromyces apiculatus]EYF08657.1 Translation initiation factor 2 [Chondromyces apiculatus DSM 436]
MPDLDAISDAAYVAAGADFAFVLTLSGRLLTRHAPRDMPREGRTLISQTALSLAPGARFGHLELPREDLVPYGGAAPIEVYFGISTTDRILCLVMSTWAARDGVAGALDTALQALEDLDRPAAPQDALDRLDVLPDAAAAVLADAAIHTADTLAGTLPAADALPAAAARPVPGTPNPSAPDLAPPSVREAPPPSRREGPASGRKSSAGRKAHASRPGPPESRPAPSEGRKRSAVAGLASLASGPSRSRARAATPPPVPVPVVRIPGPPPKPAAARARRTAPLLPTEVSLLDIRVGEATLGRESLAAIERELGLGRASLPDVRVGVAPVGRETLVAIEADLRESARPGSAPEAVRFELGSISRESLQEIATLEAHSAAAGPRPSMPLIVPARMTQPWVESAEDAKRASDAAARARKVAPPDLHLQVIDADPEIHDLARSDRPRPARRPRQ